MKTALLFTLNYVVLALRAWLVMLAVGASGLYPLAFVETAWLVVAYDVLSNVDIKWRLD